jgi:hypothetical protein
MQVNHKYYPIWPKVRKPYWHGNGYNTTQIITERRSQAVNSAASY